MALHVSPGVEGREKALDGGSIDRTWLPPRSHVRPHSAGSDSSDQTAWSPGLSDGFKPPQRTNTGFFSIDSRFKHPDTTFSRFTGWIEKIITRMICPEMFIVGIFLISIYSTVLSAVWLFIAIIKPHWGSFIAMNYGALTPRVASILVAGFAKTIEMSFSTVMITCVGQYLTNKAKQKGISLIDLQLKSMILLPMSLVTQKGGVRALLRSGMLGFLCILAYTAAALYTTASDATVSPRIDLSPSTLTNLSAYVRTSVANTYYIGQSCPNPPSSVMNDETCITTEHAGISLRNYLEYLTNWQTTTAMHQPVTEFNKPVPMASYGDSIAVQGQWLYPVNYTDLSKANKRLVSGTEMAMPFAGVINATTIAENKLDITGQLGGQLKVSARAVTPVVGVTCAVVTEKELVPIIYTNWTHPGNTTLDGVEFEGIWKGWEWRTNATAFDDLFGFNNETRHRPVFYNLPSQYNSEFDGEGTYRDMLYILFNSNVSTSATVEESQYTLCGMNFTLMGGCSSVYAANSSGTSLTLDCGKNNDMAYPMDTIGLGSGTPQDWVNVAAVWGRSISLGSGIFSTDAATVALLTQLAPTDTTFNPVEPSLADSLAILSAGTMLQSTTDTPFDGAWPFQTPPEQHNILPTAIVQKFQAKVEISDYSSGTQGDWKDLFVAELFLVVLLNVAALTYLTVIVFGRISISKKGIRRVPPQAFQEDVTELREVFTAAIHSPTVRIINTSRPGSGTGIKWKYRNGVFRPSRLATYASNSDSLH